MSPDFITSATSDRAALEAFAALTQAALHATDLVQVVQQAAQVLQSYVPDLNVGFYQRQNDHMVAMFISENIPPEVAVVLKAGLPVSLPAAAGHLR